MKFYITTTGVVSEVVFGDLGGRTYTHPTTDYDLLQEFEIDELLSSDDLQTAIDNIWVTATSEDGGSISSTQNYLQESDDFSEERRMIAWNLILRS